MLIVFQPGEFRFEKVSNLVAVDVVRRNVFDDLAGDFARPFQFFS